VKVVNGIVVDKFDELCNPGRKIVPRIARLTHIADSMVSDKPSVDEVIKQFKAFVGDSVLIGHNIKGCDIPHITRAARRAGVQFDNSYLDTKILAKKHKETHGWKNIKLTTLSEYFCITQTEAHRAWCDAEANAYVYLKLKEL
jgi:DNA polymerase III alpha subunit (gram-positive type)